jgi:hypothetical protein
MVYFFSLRSNFPIVASMTQAELSAIEVISTKNGIHVKIEPIEQGAIVYMDDTFPKERFLQFRSIYLQNTQKFDKDRLPAEYMTWYDSMTGETVYFAAPVRQYLQNKLDAVKAFIGPTLGAKLMEDIYRRIVEGNGGR